MVLIFMTQYLVKSLNDNDIKVRVPGSKSITNRALLIAALADGRSLIKGTLRSDDSIHFLNSLISLGFEINETDEGIYIMGNGGDIPVRSGTIDVGSAGTAARFLTAMLALSDGVYTVNASPQMCRRPMSELLEVLEGLGASFEYLGEPYSLPFRVTGRCNPALNNINMEEYSVSVSIDSSSQYLSALLMNAPMLKGRLKVRLTGKRKAKAYVAITEKIMESFGIDIENPSENEYVVPAAGYSGREYMCEPDVSAACYFYAMAAITGREAVVYDVYRTSMQGDIRFLDILESMGCEVYDTPDGAAVRGTGKLNGIEVDMGDCSDQTMTLAAIAPYASSKVTIRGVAHIRGQESDRLAAIADALERMGIDTREYEDGIRITPGKPQSAHIHTFGDHRMAMAFAVTGLMAEGIIIDDPECCAKTFPDYFRILDSITH